MWKKKSNIGKEKEMRDDIYKERITINYDNFFPFLDMELKWNSKKELRFSVHFKPNQKLKYLNNGSCHTRCCMKAIPSGVIKRLAKLTSREGNLKAKMDNLYPNHAEALRKAGLAPKEFPTLEEVGSNSKSSEEIKKKRRLRKFTRQIFFCVGVSKAFEGKNAIHIIIKKLRDKHNLKWLRTSMSYHKFANLSEMFASDVNKKLMEGIGSKDFDTLKCNCYSTKVDGKCIFNLECRKSIVVYKAECKECGMHYIGNTQQKLKSRMNQHFIEAKNLVNKGKPSDSFAAHFASHFENKDKNNKNIEIKDIRNLIKMSILWKGKPISCNKSFGKLNCYLCMNERIQILKSIRRDMNSKERRLINNNTEIFGSCRHKTKFHRYTNCLSSADDGLDPEKSEQSIPRSP